MKSQMKQKLKSRKLSMRSPVNVVSSQEGDFQYQISYIKKYKKRQIKSNYIFDRKPLEVSGIFLILLFSYAFDQF